MDKKKTAALIMVLIGVVLAVVGYLVLPETVVIQIDTHGRPANTLPKVAAIIIPLLFNVVGAVIHVTAGESQSRRAVIISGAGYALALLSIIINLALK